MLTSQDIIFRIILAIMLSGAIGFERGLRHKGAGLRTHILVGVGSTLIVITSLHLFFAYKDIATVDPTRMITGIITGIGFLCAGTIMRAGSHVSGLTTAATLWIVSGIGIAIGSGCYFAAIVVTFIVFLVLSGISTIKKKAKKIIPDKK